MILGDQSINHSDEIYEGDSGAVHWGGGILLAFVVSHFQGCNFHPELPWMFHAVMDAPAYL